MQVLKVLVADPVSQRGLDEIASGGELEVVVKTDLSESELIRNIPEFSALVVRSQTKVTAAVLEAARKLKVVGRAGGQRGGGGPVAAVGGVWGVKEKAEGGRKGH